ncbi:MAG: dihydrolipoyl dehydrogenase [Termitinemataceae bacterium]
MSFDYDILFIGAGPAGYVGAIRARQLGLKTAVVERDKVGGVCLNVGCIPSKALIEQATRFRSLKDLEQLGVSYDLSGFDYRKVHNFSRSAADRLSKGVEYLLKKNGVDVIFGTARFEDSHRLSIVSSKDGSKSSISAFAIVVATGSRPRIIKPFQFDEERILSSTGILMLQRVPERLLILGAGAIGMEFAYIMSSFGSQVQVVEMLDRVLPMEDADAAQVVQGAFEKRGVRFYTGMQAVGFEQSEIGTLRLTLQKTTALQNNNASASESSSKSLENDTMNTPVILEGDVLLVSTGRSPNTEDLGLENLGIRLERGYVTVHDYYETDASSIYAVGDIVAGEAQLAHVASAQAELVAERVAFLLGKADQPRHTRIDRLTVPQAVYCEPGLASFGYHEETLNNSGKKYKKALFPFRGIGKAVATGHPDGFVKLLSDPATGEILGATVVGSGATELIHEILLATTQELTVSELGDMVHAHPTLSEGIKEAALAALDRAIHI